MYKARQQYGTQHMTTYMRFAPICTWLADYSPEGEMFSNGTFTTNSDAFNVRYTYSFRYTHKWAQDLELLGHEYISNFLT
jgi:hypothetical protein